MQVPGFELPDWVMQALAPTPNEFQYKLRPAAAVFWHSRARWLSRSPSIRRRCSCRHASAGHVW
jgi:hypothetical protein